MPSKRSDHELAITTRVKDLASKELRGLGDTGKKAGDSIAAGFIKAQLAIGAMKAAVRGAVEFVKGLTTDVAAQGDEMAKLARRLGIGIETLSSFAHVAKLGGSNVQEMGNALRFLQKAAYESTAEGGSLATAKRAFDALGVSVTDSSGNLKTAEQLFYDVADAMAKLGAGAKRTALAQELFGRSGLTMIPIIEEGTDAIRKQQEQAYKFGSVWTAVTGKFAEDFEDARHNLDLAIEGLKMSIGTQLLPVLSEGLTKLANYIAENRDTIANTALDVIEEVSRYVFQAVRFAAGAVGDILDMIESIRKTLNSIPGIDLGASQRTKDLDAAKAEQEDALQSILRTKRQLVLLDKQSNRRYAAELEAELKTATDAYERAAKRVAELQGSIGDDIRQSLDAAAKRAAEIWSNTKHALGDTETPKAVGHDVGQAYAEGVGNGITEGITDASANLQNITRNFEQQIALMLAPDDMAREMLKVRQTLSEVVRQADLVGASADDIEKFYQTMLQFKRLSEQKIADQVFGSEFAKSVDEGRRAVDEAAESLKKYRQIRDDAAAAPPPRAPATFTEALGESMKGWRGLEVELGYSTLPTLTGAFDNFFTTIETGSASAGQAFRAFAMDILQAVQRLAVEELVVQLLGAIFPAARTWGKPAPSTAPPVEAHAAGGIVTRPQIGLIGEAGPEAIIPLNRMRDMGGGGGGPVTINQTIIAPPGTSAREVADLAAEGVMRKLRYDRTARQTFRKQLGGGL